MFQFHGLPTGILLSTLVLALSPISVAQDETSSIHGHIGVGIKASFLGAGVEAATPFSRRADLRVGFNTFRYGRNFHKDGISYGGRLNFQSVEAHYDWFPFYGGFHLSPGALVHKGKEHITTAMVPRGPKFTLNYTNYVSASANSLDSNWRNRFLTARPTSFVG